MSSGKEQHCCLNKFKFAVCKIFKQFLNKDNSQHGTKPINFDCCKNVNKTSFLNEIEQNQANERILKAAQQSSAASYVLAIETEVGCFYWDYNMQPDSFADIHLNIHC